MIAFHRDKDIDMLKLGCTLPNLAKNCLHKSTDAKFYPLTEGDKDLLEKKSRTSQLYPYSTCQHMPTSLNTRWDFHSETSRFIPRQNITRSFETMVMSYFQRTRPM